MTRVAPHGALFDIELLFDVDDYTYFYSDELTDERSDSEVTGWVKLLSIDTPSRILDVACGFGRTANRLAALGHLVTGLDITPGFLDIARQDAIRMGLQVDYRRGDMRQLSLDEEFDRVLLLFTSFGYFEDDENLHVMQNIARALRPGGMLGFDIPNRDACARGGPASHVVEKDGGLMINRLTFDPLTGRMQNRRIVVRDGVRKDKPFSIRLYSATEIRPVVRAAGLEVVGIYSDFDCQPLSADSRVMLVVARKPVP